MSPSGCASACSAAPAICRRDGSPRRISTSRSGSSEKCRIPWGRQSAKPCAAKSRVGGPDYLYSLLIGYDAAPAGFTVFEGKYYNTYFAGHNIAMPKPLNENGVTYSDGTKASVDQQAKDVSAFLMWAAEPKMEQRKEMGVSVIIFLLGLSTLLFLSYRKLWAGQH